MSAKRLAERSEDKAAKEPKDERLAYEPPRAMRLGDTHAGAGACGVPGSGDVEGCYNGNSASGYGCNQPGNSASDCAYPGSSAEGYCSGAGSSAVGDCFAPGSGFAGG